MGRSDQITLLSRIVDACALYRKCAKRYGRYPNDKNEEALDEAKSKLIALVANPELAFADEILADVADQRLPDLFGLSQAVVREILRAEYAASSDTKLGKAVTKAEVERVIVVGSTGDVSLPSSRAAIIDIVEDVHGRIIRGGASKRNARGKVRAAAMDRLVRRCLGGIFGTAFLLCNTITRQIQHSASIAETFFRDAERR